MYKSLTPSTSRQGQSLAVFAITQEADLLKSKIKNQTDNRSQRPHNTTLPLAESLGISNNHPCNYVALAYTGPGNVLIAWEHIPALQGLSGHWLQERTRRQKLFSQQ